MRGKFAEIGWKLLIFAGIAGIALDGQTWLDMAVIHWTGWKWLKSELWNKISLLALIT